MKGSNLPSTQPPEKVRSLAAILKESWFWSRNPAPSQTLLYQSFIRLSSGYLHLGISLQSKDTSAICNTTIQAEFSRTAAEMNCKGAINPLCPLSPPACICCLNPPISSQSKLDYSKVSLTVSSLLIFSHFHLPGTHSPCLNLSGAMNSNLT